MSAPRPTAAPARWPYREHRSMAQVMRDEAPFLAANDNFALSAPPRFFAGLRNGLAISLVLWGGIAAVAYALT